MADIYSPDQEQRGYDMLNGAGEGSYAAHYYMPGSGISQEWFITNFYQKENESLADAYARMDRDMAEIDAGSGNLFAIGMLGGTVMPFNGDLRGVFLGQTWTHTPAHFYRALTESFAFALKTAMERMDAMYPQYRKRACIRMIGGGARSDVSAQIFADALGIRVETLESEEPALFGACLLGAKGIGLIENLEEAAKACVRVRKAFEPKEENHRKYEALRERYNRYIGILSPLCREVGKGI
jgi:xylulokinase